MKTFWRGWMAHARHPVAPSPATSICIADYVTR